MRKTSQALAISSVFASGSALETLRNITGADKIGRHDAIVATVATIIALALCNAPPKGQGNAADHSKVAAVFTEARMPRYAEACIGLGAAIKAKGHRSIAEWDDALIEGAAMASGMFADLRPKVYSKAELAAREVTRAAKKNEREQAAKVEAEANAAKVEAAKVEAEKQAFERGAAQARAEFVVTAEMVADMIRSGQFGDSLNLIREALDSVTVRETIVA